MRNAAGLNNELKLNIQGYFHEQLVNIHLQTTTIQFKKEVKNLIQFALPNHHTLECN